MFFRAEAKELYNLLDFSIESLITTLNLDIAISPFPTLRAFVSPQSLILQSIRVKVPDNDLYSRLAV